MSASEDRASRLSAEMLSISAGLRSALDHFETVAHILAEPGQDQSDQIVEHAMSEAFTLSIVSPPNTAFPVTQPAQADLSDQETVEDASAATTSEDPVSEPLSEPAAQLSPAELAVATRRARDQQRMEQARQAAKHQGSGVRAPISVRALEEVMMEPDPAPPLATPVPEVDHQQELLAQEDDAEQDDTVDAQHTSRFEDPAAEQAEDRDEDLLDEQAEQVEQAEEVFAPRFEHEPAFATAAQSPGPERPQDQPWASQDDPYARHARATEEPKKPRDSDADNNLLSKLFAAGGGLITLIGISFLLVMGARNGLFTPPLRVGGLIVLSAVLFVAGSKVRTKWDNLAGAVAIVAVGFAGLYLTAVSATAIFEGMLPTLPGLLIALGVSLVGLEVARRWKAQSLAIANVVSVVISLQYIGIRNSIDASLLAAFILVLTLGTARVLLKEPTWVGLGALSVASLFFYQLAASMLIDSADPAVLTALVVAGSAVSIWIWSVVGHYTAFANAYLTPAAALYALPVLLVADAHADDRGYLLALLGTLLVALVVVCAIDAGGKHFLPTAVGTTFWAIAGAYLLTLTLYLTVGAYEVVAVLAHAAVLSVVTYASKTKTSFFLSLAFGLVGLVGFGSQVNLRAFWSAYDSSHLATWPVILGALLLAGWAMSSMLTFSVVFPGALAKTRLWVPYMVLCWYGLVSAAILAPVRLFDGTRTRQMPNDGRDFIYSGAPLGTDAIPGVDGYLVGIMLSTLGLAVLALVLLEVYLKGRPSAFRSAGLATLALVVAKVFLIDIDSLSPALRVVAFMGVGLILLALGARYGKKLTARRDEPIEETEDEFEPQEDAQRV